MSSRQSKFLNLRISPWVGALLYLTIAGFWIAGGDFWLDHVSDVNDPRHNWLHAVVDTSFLTVTTLLVWWMLRRASAVWRSQHQSAVQLQQLVESIPDHVFIKDPQGRFVQCNVPVESLLGAKIEDIIGHTDDDFVPAELAASFRAMDRQVMAQRTPVRFEEWVRNHRGDEVLLETTKAPLFDTNGDIFGVLGVARDITASHHAAEKLRDSEARLRAIVEALPDRLFLVDQNDCFAAVWAPDESLLSRPPQQWIGLDVSAMLPTDMLRRARTALVDARHGQPCQVFTESFVTQTGTRWFDLRVVGAGNGQVLVLARDITDDQRTQENLRVVGTVLSSTQEGVMIIGIDGLIRKVNQAFTQLMGYSEAEVVGRSPALLRTPHHHSPAYFEEMRSIVDSTGSWRGEIWHRRKDGTVFPATVSMDTVYDTQGEATHNVAVITDTSRLKASEAELAHLAHHDPLTELPNRLLFFSRLEHALKDASRANTHCAVLVLDLDRFKDVNDSYGHAAGDELLQHVAQRLQSRLRRADTLARLGGDEFALLMDDLPHPNDAARLAGELIAALTEPCHLSVGAEVSAGASVGICLFPQHGQTPQALLQGADAAMYRAKADGRGLYVFYSDDMTHAARERLSLESRLRRALAEGQFCLHYQPQVDIATGRIVGAEALVRWHEPVEGLIPPARFIPVAEATGLIRELGAWVLEEACRQGQLWRAAGLPPLRIAVNVSPRQFRHVDLATQVTQVLQHTGFPAEWLELELTESALMEREAEALETLQRLRALGIGLAIDDFGTGYSSLAYLKRFPLDVLKIDRGFIADIPNQADDMAIASAIIAMGHSLGILVLAEGVETPEQLAFLSGRGCNLYQGYLRSRPVPAEEFARLLTQPVATDFTFMI
ncbi:sensor domain-containing protein [Variovorax sp. HJSM1_2]|uniref:sensor domain-containing protein n=1 Tax=Variovorax sp. HJSM1_2 TaxID=3366263 RepID=UPI003BD2AAAD